MNIFTVPAVLTVDNSVVDLETIEALYENVSMKEQSVEGNKTKEKHKAVKSSDSVKENRESSILYLLLQIVMSVPF